jgi:hypothetical protein
MTDSALPRDDAPAEVSGAEAASASPETPVEPVFPSERTLPVRSRWPIGPGLWEALLWIIGFFAIELASSFVWGAGITGYLFATEGGLQPDRLKQVVAELMPWMIGSAKLVEVAAAVFAIRLRFGAGALRATGFRRVPVLQGVILIFAVLPAAVLCSQLYALAHFYWEWLAHNVAFLRRFLEGLEHASSIETVQKMAESNHWTLLVLVIAVFPALNEEFVFRAAIGRGLLGRYGLVAGIALTSMLFAAVHLSPIHAFALVPLAVLLHVGYLSSGSIWWPVGLHFCNNALSVGAMELATLAPGVEDIASETKFSIVLFLASLACVATTVWLLRKIQVRWVLPDGSEWRPPFPTVEPPPAAAEAMRIVPMPPALPLASTAACYLLFPVAVVVGALLNQV